MKLTGDDMTDENKEDWCPISGGTYRAFEPVVKDDDEWKIIPTSSVPQDKGVPSPLFGGVVNKAIGLMSYEQAMAIAWMYAACKSAEGIYVSVKVQAYKVVFDVKAKRLKRPTMIKLTLLSLISLPLLTSHSLKIQLYLSLLLKQEQ